MGCRAGGWTDGRTDGWTGGRVHFGIPKHCHASNALRVELCLEAVHALTKTIGFLGIYISFCPEYVFNYSSTGVFYYEVLAAWLWGVAAGGLMVVLVLARSSYFFENNVLLLIRLCFPAQSLRSH
jgi:hypothetical protein